MPPSPLLQEASASASTTTQQKGSFLETTSTFDESSSSSSSSDIINNHQKNDDQPPPPNNKKCCCTIKLPTTTTACFQKGSSSGAIANICSATLGAGVLALPYAMKSAGLILGLLLLVITSLLTISSIDWITNAMRRYPESKTYEDLTLQICGTTARYILEVLNFIFCFGTAVAYVVAVGDILDQGVTNFLPSYINQEVIMVLFWLIAMYPLSLNSKVDALRYASLVGILSVGYLVLATVIHSSRDLASSSSDGSSSLWDDVKLWPDNFWNVIQACPIIMFAFSCQPNVCAIYDELGETDHHDDDYDNNHDDDDNENLLSNSLTTTRTSSTVSDGTTLSSTSTTLENMMESSSPTPNNHSTTTPLSPINEHHHHHQNPQNQKIKQMACVTRTAITICITFYILMGIFGYANFGLNTQDNVLKNYCIHDTKDGMMIAAFVGITVAVVMAFPLNVFPARSTLDGVVKRWERWGCWRRYFGGCCCYCCKGHDTEEEEEQTCVGDSNNTTLEEPLLSSTTSEHDCVDNEGNNNNNNNSNMQQEKVPSPPQQQSQSQSPQKKPSKLRHIILTTLISGSALGVAIAIPDITIILGLMGGTASSFISFIFPALFARDAYIASKRTTPLLLVEMEDENVVVDDIEQLEEGRKSDDDDDDVDDAPNERVGGGGGLCKIVFIWFVIAVGVVVGILSTGVTVYGIFNPDSTPSTCSSNNKSGSGVVQSIMMMIMS